MSRKTMIVLATAATLTGGLTADAFAQGYAGYGGGFGAGAHNPRPWFTVPRYVPPLPQPEYMRRRPWSAPAIPRFGGGRRT